MFLCLKSARTDVQAVPSSSAEGSQLAPLSPMSLVRFEALGTSFLPCETP